MLQLSANSHVKLYPVPNYTIHNTRRGTATSRNPKVDKDGADQKAKNSPLVLEFDATALEQSREPFHTYQWALTQSTAEAHPNIRRCREFRFRSHNAICILFAVKFRVCVGPTVASDVL
jgi:hypothetical protein